MTQIYYFNPQLAQQSLICLTPFRYLDHQSTIPASTVPRIYRPTVHSFTIAPSITVPQSSMGVSVSAGSEHEHGGHDHVEQHAAPRRDHHRVRINLRRYKVYPHQSILRRKTMLGGIHW